MSNVVTQPHLPFLHSYLAYMYIIPSPGLGKGYSIEPIYRTHAIEKLILVPLSSTRVLSPQGILYARHWHKTPSRAVGATSSHHSLRRHVQSRIERVPARAEPSTHTHTHTHSLSLFSLHCASSD